MEKSRSRNNLLCRLSELIFALILFCVFISYVKAAIPAVGDTTNFGYTGGVQTFTAPATGYYQLETWGAQGGSQTGVVETNGNKSTNAGGYGAYSTGIVFLNKGDVLYIVVGGQGGNITSRGPAGAAGYNGGGRGGAAVNNGFVGSGGGGGATHIALVSGTLSSLSGYKGTYNSTTGAYESDNILIVAGGGGGASWCGTSGHGGGIKGNSVTCGSRVANGATQSTGSAFGQGQAGKQGFNGSGDCEGTGGGGGGFFGGYAYQHNGGGTGNNVSGAGGSGYIGSTRLMSYGSYTKTMYCYNCTTSTAAQTKTVSTTNVSGSAVSNYVKTGSGYAKIRIVELANDDSRIASVSMSGTNSFNPAFDKDTFTYDVIVDSENYDVDIDATAVQNMTIITGEGNYQIEAGLNTITLTGTSDTGRVSVYTLNVTRVASSYKYLKDIKISGESITGFQPEKLVYDINVDYSVTELDLEAIKGRTSQNVFYPNSLRVNSGRNTYSISVVSEDNESVTTYTLNVNKPHSSKLKSLVIDGYELDTEFDPENLSYTIQIMSNAMSLKIITEAFDEEATISLSGFGYIKASGVGKITVKEPNSPTTVYNVTIIKEGAVEQTLYEYPYKGYEQTFEAPATGYYLLETWGGQGGSQAGVVETNNNKSYNIGGYGAYSQGTVYLKKGELLYINVGGQGQNITGRSYGGAGGYNGGGNGGAANNSGFVGSGGGGGATHIATVSGLLKTLSNNIDDILIISGGGGGASWTGHLASGGGIKGNSITSGSKVSQGATQTTGYAFGQGQNGLKGFDGSANCEGTGGGGGGLYGGYTYQHTWSGTGNTLSGAGGSGYIGNDNLISYKEYTKSMYCYNCATSNQESTYTVSTNKYSSTPTSYYAKSGAGYARITLLPQPSENNFLSRLTVKATNYETEEVTTKSYTSSFEMEVEDYYVTLDKMETEVAISAKPEDSLSKIEGLGTYDIPADINNDPAGPTVITITVTAEAGNTKDYRIHFTRPADDNPYPDNITISGLVPSLCSVDTEVFCRQDAIRFDKDIHTYYLTVPSRIKQLWFNVQKGHPYQEVNGEGKVTLAGGENNFTVAVEAEDKSASSVYNYVVIRDMTGNTDLDPLHILEPERDIDYDPDITEYYLSVPNNYTKYKDLDTDEIDTSLVDTVQFYTKTDDPNASYIVSGPDELVVGMNQINIFVTAANGETNTYVLNVYRMQNENVFLSELKVSKDGTVYEMIPTFNQIKTGEYRVTVPNDVTSVLITATPEVNTTTVSGAGTKNLNTGDNKFKIKTTAENANITEEYTLVITREKNANAYLNELHVKDGENELLPALTFNKETYEYEINVSEGLNSVNITALTEVTTTTYKLLDNATIRVGNNRKRVMTIAEDGTSLTYTVNIIRPASTDNTLKSLSVYKNEQNFTLTPNFDSNVNEYELAVENDVNYVNVLATKNNNLATVTGNGRYNLQVGNNEINITVKSEDGNVNTYKVVITRKANSNAYLSEIRYSAGTFNEQYDKTSSGLYTITVPHNVNKITIEGIPEVTTTTVTGNNSYNLVTGNNPVTLTTLAEDGVSTMTYNLTVIKEISTVNTLDDLYMEEGSLSPSFTSENTMYIVKIPYDVTSGHFHVRLSDEKASYTITGADSFVEGDNEVLIEVEAENGSKKTYTVIVHRQSLEEVSNYLLSIKVSEGTLTPIFNKETLYYEVEVPYSVTSEVITAKKEDEFATVTGTGSYPLEVGNNLAAIKVQSADGKERTYQVLIKRLENTEARIANLVVLGSELTPIFDKDTYEYSLQTNDDKLTFTTLTLVDPNATYEVVGNHFTEAGEYTVKINVTAQNGIDKKEYIFTVDKLPSNNNNLIKLEVEGYSINPSFVPSTTVYRLIVGNDVNSVNIIAEAADSNATLSGTGIQMLDVGDNYLTVEVTSQSGKVKSYTIIVTKNGSSNNELTKLEVLNGTMDNTYSNDISSYNVVIPYEETELDLNIVLADETASYAVSGNSDLPVGNSKVYVNVTSENGDVRTIVLNVTRKEIVSPLLKNLKIRNYELNPLFNSYVTDYNVTVDNEINTLLLDVIETLDPNATYEVTGNEDFVVGNNDVQIVVTSSNGIDTETYTLHVNKQAYSNTFLDYLYTSEGDVTPTFVKTTMEYSINVYYEVSSIELFAEAVDASAKVEITYNGVTTEAIKDLGTNKYNGELGTFNLSTGENKINITVTSTSGTKRNYYVIVNRAKEDNNYLKSLDAKVGAMPYSLSPDFVKTTTSYTINVPVGTAAININGEAESETSTVSGIGITTLHAGNNEIIIKVVSEAGNEREYKVTVVRPASINNHLIELTPSSGILEPEFNYDIDPSTLSDRSYSLNLDSGVAYLSFDAIAEDDNASVSGNEKVLVPDGLSTRTITVTAEDGSTREYIININKERTDDASLKALYVTGYPFVDELNNTVTFNPGVYDYYINVPNSKKLLLKEDVIATTNDPNAKITKDANLTLVTGDSNVYSVLVTAPDGFTKQTYKIHVNRGLNDISTLNSLVVNTGYLTSVFNPNVKEYTWMIAKNAILGEGSVTAVATDPNATIIKTNYLVYTVDGDNTYEVKVIAEDGSNSTTYKLHLELDLSADATLGSLTIDKGYYKPTFDPDNFVYNVYEYVDIDEITVTAVPNNENSVVISGNGTVALTKEETTHKIIVEAEDGTQEEYTLNIYKMILRDETLDDLYLNGLDDLECIDDKCILSPVFNSDVVSYKIKVPYEYENLDVYYKKKNDQQTVKIKVGENYVDSYSLSVGKTKVIVEVYDGMNKLTKSYELEVDRCKSNNTYLKSLEIEDYLLDPDFDKIIQEYTIYVGKDVTDLTLEMFTAVPEFAESRVYINNYTYLEEGNNDCDIEVIAPDGSTRTYIIHIIRASEYNSKLKNITVSTGVFWELSPKFKSTTFEYTVIVPGQYSKATVEAVPIDPETTILGTGEYELVTGNNPVTLTATNNGQVNVYNVNIIKLANDDVDLVSLIVEEGDISPTFDRSNTKYSVVAPENADSLTIHAIPSSREATVTITGNQNLHSGKNIVNIIVQNKDKTKTKTYQLTVTKDRSSNNLLDYIKVFDDEKTEYELDPEYYELTNYYKVELPDTLEKVTVDAKTQDINALITGLGDEYLNYGSNMKEIIVTAENGNVNTYYINLYRAYNLNLKLLECDKGELDSEFDPNVTEYVVELDKTKTDITFVAKAESNKVAVTGSGTYNLVPGDNEIEFVVKDPDGNEKIYTVNVKKAKDENNYIQELTVGGILTPVFDKETGEYTVDARKEVTSLDLEYTLESPVATSRVIGNSNFALNQESEVIIEVTAENGDVRNYIFKVTPRPDEFFSNRLLDLAVSKGQLTPDFNPDINYYAVTVPNSDTELTITTVKENEYATVSIGGVSGGIRTVSLNVGRNVFPVVVTSQDGVSVNTYNVVIYRSENNDATLQSLMVKDLDFRPIFGKTITNYTMEVGSEVKDLDITAIPTDSNATVEISGHKNLVKGENTVTIKVTAPDGETTMRYQIVVTKSVSKNNYISELSVSGYSFDKTYLKTDQGPYTINVESNVNSVMIHAIPEVDTTTITGDGKVEISKGRNVLSVKATSESNEDRIYTIIVNRAYSIDSSLKDILVSDGDLDPVFNSETLEYTVEVTEEVEEITIKGILNDASATITGNGTYDLTENEETNVDLVVTAEDGSKTTYKVNVVRHIAASSYLKLLSVKSGELYPNFHKLITSYTILVPNEIRNLDMTYLPEDENANVVVTGNASFKVGTNKVHIIVTAKDNSSTTDYEISVVRQSKASNYLNKLEIKSQNDTVYSLVPVFDKTVTYYEVTVGTDVDTIEIFAEAEDPTATIDSTDLGYKTLHSGDNKYYVTVESASGVVRTYQILVTKMLSSDNKLISLSSDIGTWNKEFDPDITEYEITVPLNTKKIALDGTASGSSKINGLGTSDVHVGDNTRTVVVTGEDNSTTTYTITIKRPSNTNVNLTELIPSVGTLSPAYTNDVETYTISVPDTANVISFTATPEDENATVTGTDLTSIGYGNTEITVTVTGEDGETKKEITITVSRGKGLEKIEANPTSILIDKDEQKTITYILTPTDTTYTNVRWVSDDESIATVSNGVITGLSYGSTTVKVISEHDSNIYASITVNVVNKKITSSVYEIIHFTEDEKNDESLPENERPKDYTVGAEPETTIEDFIKQFDNNELTLRVYSDNEIEVLDKNAFVATGMKIKLIINEVEYDELEIAVKGDLDSDGIVTMSDYTSLKNCLLNAVVYDFIHVKAADFDNNDVIAMNDYNSLKTYLLNDISTLNKPRE